MSDPSHPSAEEALLTRGLGIVLELLRRARHAGDAAELGFLLVNDTHALAPYRQAALWFEGRGVRALSGVVQIEANAPYVHWLERVCRRLAAEPAREVDAAALDPADAAEWAHWLPPRALWLPLQTGDVRGGLLLAREVPWLPHEPALLQEWVDGWSHAWRARTAPRSRLRRLFGAGRPGRPWWRRPALIASLAAAALACLPIPLSVLAPGELVPADPAVLRSPIDGVVGQILVRPNQTVKTGQPLFTFDETDLAAKLEISGQTLATAEAEYRQTAQSAVSDGKYNLQLAALMGRIEQARAERAYWQAMLERSRVVAPQDGVVLFGDASDWTGKPVVTGERIMRIARPDDVEVEAWLGVGDAIPLPEAAPAKLYLNADPLRPLTATVRYIAHEAVQRPDGSFAYRVRARLERPAGQRIGLKGTVKLSGRRVPLIYWVARRPLAALRQGLGL